MLNTQTFTCPKCGHINNASTVNCKECQINLNWAMANLPPWDETLKPGETELFSVLAQPDGSVLLEPVQSPALPLAPADTPTTNQAAMLKEIRSWGVWSLLLGAIHLVASGSFSAPWGILLLIVGLASFIFRSASIFVVYGVIMAWAAVTNVLSGLGGWMFFALLQLYWAFRVFQQFRRFRQVERQLLQPAPDDVNASALTTKRSGQLFPWIGSLLSCSSILGILFLFVAGLLIGSMAQRTTFLNYWAFGLDLTLALGVLGFAVGLASLLSGYRPKILGIIGLVSGIVILILNLALIFLLRSA